MVYILLGEGFEEVEALCAADVLRRGGVEVALAGTERRNVTGSHNIPVVADVVCADVKLQKGDMVVLPGGLGGVESIEGSQAAMALTCQAAQDENIWLAAICAAPTLLARAGLIGPGDQAVCYPGMEGEMTQRGVTAHMDQSVVVCGRLITGRAPGSAFDFALQLLDSLKGAQAAETVRAGLHY
jgi:4-methyl-5(b-hydroxyethyl)-thiazole monophosphate biosynthesis